MKGDMLLPAILWLLFTAICLVFIIAGVNVALKKAGGGKKVSKKILTGTIAFIAVWVALLLILSNAGFFSDFSWLPPRPILIIVIPLPIILLITFSEKGTQLIRSVPPQWIVWMQSFRVGVEVLLLAAFINGNLPVQMTFEGRNFDILSGLLALPVGYILSRKKKYAVKLAIAFNIIGLLLLLNILVIAALSMPTPIRYFMNEPSNTLVAEFPFILLPGVLVPMAYGLHIFSLRQLLGTRKKLK
jgi:hypothetical protein